MMVINSTNITCVINPFHSKATSSYTNAFTPVINSTSVIYAAKHLGTAAHLRNTNAFTLLVINCTSVTCVVKHLLGTLISTYINLFTLEEHKFDHIHWHKCLGIHNHAYCRMNIQVL